jgi:hypothetical protein
VCGGFFCFLGEEDLRLCFCFLCYERSGEEKCTGYMPWPLAAECNMITNKQTILLAIIKYWANDDETSRLTGNEAQILVCIEIPTNCNISGCRSPQCHSTCRNSQLSHRTLLNSLLCARLILPTVIPINLTAKVGILVRIRYLTLTLKQPVHHRLETVFAVSQQHYVTDDTTSYSSR